MRISDETMMDVRGSLIDDFFSINIYATSPSSNC